MGFLALIPGLFTLLDRVLGPLFTDVTKSSVVTSIFSSGSLGGVLGVLTKSLGSIESAKIEEIKAGIAELEAQAGMEEKDVDSKSIFASWHAMFCWGMSIILLVHFASAELLNQLVAWHVASVGLLAPLDTATLTIACLILGGSMAGKTVEKVNSNNSDSD
jgi:hypothetical protein